MSVQEEIDALADRVVASLEDAGEARMAKAQVRRSYAEALVRKVSGAHGVTVKAVLGQHRARQKAHVVMARAQAAYLLRQASFSYPEIARLLSMSHHSQAMRGVRQWEDKLAGLDKMVDEATARKAMVMMRRLGLTMSEVAERLEVSPLRLRGRIGIIRDREKENG